MVCGDRSEKISWRQNQFERHTTSISGSNTQKCSCLGFNAVWSPFEILNPVALSLICVFCMKDSGAHAQGLEPQLSAVLPAASLPPQEGFSAACLRLVELGSSKPGRKRPAHCCHPPSPAETRHRGKESQGWACAPLCLGQDGICSQPGLAVP